MYNFLVVDNERIICDGMKKALENTHYFNVFEAFDGEQALHMISEHSIRAMILDIAMPGMNGVELMKELRKRNLQPLIVVVSGYDDFSYVKEALNYGATDYLLKPIDSEDVVNIGGKLLDLIVQQDKQQQETDKMKKFVLDNMDTIRQKVIYDILNNGISPERLKNMSEFYNLDISGNRFCAAVIVTDKKNADLSEMDYQIKLKLIEDKIKACIDNRSSIHLIIAENSKFVLLFSSDQFDKRYIQTVLNKITDELVNIPDIGYYLGEGNEVDSCNIPESYRNAIEALDYKSMFGSGTVYSIEDYRKDDYVQYLEKELFDFEAHLKLMQYKEAKEELVELFQYIKNNQKHFNVSHLRFILMRCVVIFSALLLDNGQDVLSLTSEEVLYQYIHNSDSISYLEIHINKMLDSTIERISDGYKNGHKKLADIIKQSIDSNYRDGDLSVATLSVEFNYSPNYLGNVFRKEFSITINDYLNQYRIAKAKKLMDETDLKVYEIAFNVGFRDQHYFSKQFKRYENMSPKEYKENH